VPLKAIGISRVCLVLAAFAAVVLVAGCGSSSNSGSTESASSSTTEGGEPSPSGEPVKLGMIAAQGVPEGSYGAEIAAVESAVNALNKRGGIEGRPVELVYCNDKADPNVTTACGREMVEEEVVAVVGGGAFNGNVLVPIFEKAEIPSIGITAGDPQQLNAKDYFYFTIGPAQGTVVMAAYAAQAGLKTSLFVVENPSDHFVVESIQSAAKEAGAPLVSTVEVPVAQADFAPIIAAGKPEEANAAMMLLENEGPLVQAAAGEEWSPTWLLDADPAPAMAEAVAETNGGIVTNVVYPSPFPPITPESKDPEILRYLEELEAGVEEGVPHANEALSKPTYTGIEGWLAVQVVAQLVEEGKVKELTGPSMLETLRGVKGLNIGLLKSWSPNVPGPEGFSRSANLAFNVIEVNAGKYKSLTKEPVTAEELIAGEVSVPPPASAK
jgi:ABC-type branched-subunit amino acid transport system substrate-binding protein